MNEPSPTLQRLISALDALPVAPNLLRLARTLEQCPLELSDVEPWVRETSATYHRATVVRRDGYELLVITWKNGQGSAPHDHCGSVSAMKVISGTAVEETFVPSDDGYAQHVSSTEIKAGGLTAWHDSGVHAIRNPGGDVLVTLNVYSPPLTDFRRFATEPKVSRPTITVKSPRCHTVLVVGGGFSGTMTAAQLLRKAENSGTPLRVVLTERRGTLGEGVAYSTPDEAHLLNVPAGRMSAWPDRPGDFVEWVTKNIRAVEPGEFVPRCWFGRYVRETLVDVSRQAVHSKCDTVLDEVRRITRHPDSGWIVHFARGSSLVVDDVVLAIGHRPPADPLAACWNGSRSHYIADPWRPFACSAVEKSDPVVVLGSGLSAVDTLMSLGTSERTAPVYLISRRGLLPRMHRKPGPAAADLSAMIADCLQQSGGLSFRSLTARMRKLIEGEIGKDQGQDWRAFIDGLRPHTNRIWQSASASERTRFLRHIRPIWEVLRHRMAPEIGERLSQWTTNGLVKVVPGRISSVIASADELQVLIRERGEERLTPLKAKWILNCTGPEPSNRPESNPAIGSLLLHGWLVPDSLHLGLATTSHGTAIAANGNEVTDLRIVGTLRKPDSWESTAVPELRVQAEAAASQILSSIVAPQAQSSHRRAA